MPKKSINLSLAAIAKVEKLAEEQDRNFSNMLETIIKQHGAATISVESLHLALERSKNRLGNGRR